jgi:hypothetical protein
MMIQIEIRKKKQALADLRELLYRFEKVCKDVDGNTDPEDKRRMRNAAKAISFFDEHKN